MREKHKFGIRTSHNDKELRETLIKMTRRNSNNKYDDTFGALAYIAATQKLPETEINVMAKICEENKPEDLIYGVSN